MRFDGESHWHAVGDIYPSEDVHREFAPTSVHGYELEVLDPRFTENSSA